MLSFQHLTNLRRVLDQHWIDPALLVTRVRLQVAMEIVGKGMNIGTLLPVVGYSAYLR